ncbi:MAG: Holliday junction resolvase RecU [Alphaproteobacteria bacterium]|nr:Holliday junction resolvase RecU [Alphaproteobacteria bacterium]
MRKITDERNQILAYKQMELREPKKRVINAPSFRDRDEQAKYRHSIAGRTNKTNGKAFEEIIERSCARYAEAGIAEIEKTPEPMRPIQSLGSGRFIACFEKKAQPDFKGSLSGGITVAFEAKFTDSDRIKQTVVTDDQAKALDRLHNMGARCFVLVSFAFYEFYRIPWAVWRDMKCLYGRKYVTPGDIEEYAVKFNGFEINFLDGMTT